MPNNRQLKSISTSERYEVKAKHIRKGDSIWVGKRCYRVKSNIKDDDGKRVIRLQWGSRKRKDEVLLAVPKNVLFSVTVHKHIRNS